MINIYQQYEKKRPRTAKICFFPLETLKNLTLNNKLYPQLTIIRAIFCNFRKREGESSPSPFPSSSYAHATETIVIKLKSALFPLHLCVMYRQIFRASSNSCTYTYNCSKKPKNFSIITHRFYGNKIILI